MAEELEWLNAIDVDEGEEIYYEDFTSLYPTINKYCTNPASHPTILVNPESQNITDYFGLDKVSILAAEKVFHPVLPVKNERQTDVSFM